MHTTTQGFLLRQFNMSWALMQYHLEGLHCRVPMASGKGRFACSSDKCGKLAGGLAW